MLLADLLDWHPRDDKPAWWRHFYLRTLSPAELIGEPDALGGLTGGELVGQVRKSVLRRFFFPPQEYKFSTGDTACDPATDKQWTVCDVDDARRVSGGDAATALLLRRPPDDGGGAAGSLRAEGETASAAAVRLAVSLRDSYLPMQGPPGTGKTYTAALRAGPKLMFEA